MLRLRIIPLLGCLIAMALAACHSGSASNSEQGMIGGKGPAYTKD